MKPLFSKPNPLKVELYRDRKKMWRIRMWRSGRKTWVTGEGYKRRQGAINMFWATRDSFQESEYATNFHNFQ